jgi:hypothetical protein
MKLLEKLAAAVLILGAVYVVGIIFLAFCYFNLKALGL